MFGTMIYYDERKISEFKAIIRGEKNIKISKVDITDDKGANLNLPILGGKMSATKNYEATIEESNLFDCFEFEQLLDGRDDYFDFTEKDEIDIVSLTRGTIIKFDSTLYIPEEFDLTQTIAQFKPYIVSSVSKDMDRDESEAFKAFFKTTDAKIPVLTECNNIELCSKLNSNNLMVGYTELEEYELIEVTILARIISSKLLSTSKPIYDPLKDFITLNRSARRSWCDERPDGLKEIFNQAEYKTIEILAIYQ